MQLLDTNVISELRKVKRGRVDATFAAWAKTLRWSELFLSAVTVHELEVGVLRLASYGEPQGEVLKKWLHEQVIPNFDQRILPVDRDVALRGAELLVPRTRTLEDAMIAATAYVHRMPIVTRNEIDFQDCGVHIINPWTKRS